MSSLSSAFFAGRRSRRSWGLCLILVAAFATRTPVSGQMPPLKELVESRVVFVGDSITYSGQYVEFFEAGARLRFPGKKLDWIAVGLPSETLSGLSEPGHAGGSFPRPDLHERLGRLLEQTRPGWIVACYGMNDGIYHPFSNERFEKFQSGIIRLRAAASNAGARVLHLTPPVFDVAPIRKGALPAGLPEYRGPYVGYDDVLTIYSDWLLAQRPAGWAVVDIHGPMLRALADRRLKDPGFRFAGDGVHADVAGHWLMAGEVLKAFGLEDLARHATPEAAFGSLPEGAAVLQAVQQRQRALKDSWLTAIGHKRPGMGKGPGLEKARENAGAAESELQKINPERSTP